MKKPDTGYLLLRAFYYAKDFLLTELLAKGTVRASQIDRCPKNTPLLDHLSRLVDRDSVRERINALRRRRLNLITYWIPLIQKDLSALARIDPSETATSLALRKLEQAIDGFGGSIAQFKRRLFKDMQRIRCRFSVLKRYSISTRSESYDDAGCVSFEDVERNDCVCPGGFPSPEELLLFKEQCT
jgi:hypothetical protein